MPKVDSLTQELRGEDPDEVIQRLGEPEGWDLLMPREKALYLMKRGGEYELSFSQMAARTGLSPRTLKNYWQQVRRKLRITEVHAQPSKELLVVPQEPTNQDLAKLARRKAYEMLQAIDRAKIGEAKLRDLAYGVKETIQQAQLLLEKPTAIRRMEDRRTLDEVGRALMEEMKRRRLDAPVVDVEVIE